MSDNYHYGQLEAFWKQAGINIMGILRHTPSYGRAGPPDPAPRYRTERETFASLRS
ncbi:MAG: hypothetical protein ACE5R6_20950 [Candidatus Heimdallarchaeota archaeon]